MAATYTKITRPEFEAWLFNICPAASRQEGKQGVYLLPVSEHVWLRMSTSIGSSGEVVGNGNGACHMALIGRGNGQVLNRKATGQVRFNRTTGWRTNWARGIDSLFVAFDQHPDFYNRIGAETHIEFATRVLDDMDGLEGAIFQSFRHSLARGFWLTGPQLEVIRKAKEEREMRKPTPKNPELLGAVQALKSEAEANNDAWLVEFSTNIERLVKFGQNLSIKQAKCLDRNFARYSIPVAAGSQYA